MKFDLNDDDKNCGILKSKTALGNVTSNSSLHGVNKDNVLGDNEAISSDASYQLTRTNTSTPRGLLGRTKTQNLKNPLEVNHKGRKNGNLVLIDHGIVDDDQLFEISFPCEMYIGEIDHEESIDRPKQLNEKLPHSCLESQQKEKSKTIPRTTINKFDATLPEANNQSRLERAETNQEVKQKPFKYLNPPLDRQTLLLNTDDDKNQKLSPLCLESQQKEKYTTIVRTTKNKPEYLPDATLPEANKQIRLERGETNQEVKQKRFKYHNPPLDRQTLLLNTDDDKNCEKLGLNSNKVKNQELLPSCFELHHISDNTDPSETIVRPKNKPDAISQLRDIFIAEDKMQKIKLNHTISYSDINLHPKVIDITATKSLSNISHYKSQSSLKLENIKMPVEETGHTKSANFISFYKGVTSLSNISNKIKK
jgi:hypothetical protein